MKNLNLVVSTFIGLLLPFLLTAQDHPAISSWLQNTTETGTYYMSGNPTLIENNILVNCQKVEYSDDHVYVTATGIPAYPTGPFGDGNPSNAADQNGIWKIPLDPTPNTGTLDETVPGNIGIFINGVALFDFRDGVGWDSDNNRLCGGPGNPPCGGGGPGMGPPGMGGSDWNRDAIPAEREGFDCSKAHPAMGNYHHHQNPSAFKLDLEVISDICNIYDAEGLYAVDSTQHSPLIGFAYDGYPIYGAYGYANTDGTGGITRMKSSWSLRDITERTHWADGTDVDDGPPISDYFLGYFREDYEYIPNNAADYLDVHNGRICITPEYPGGTYAYFATVDENWNSTYPYVVGPTFYGHYENRKVNAVDEPTTIYVLPTTVDADGDGFEDDVDCNDNDATIFPGAEELCDGVDNNCDSVIDEGFEELDITTNVGVDFIEVIATPTSNVIAYVWLLDGIELAAETGNSLLIEGLAPGTIFEIEVRPILAAGGGIGCPIEPVTYVLITLTDADGDGYDSTEDCNDFDAAINPGMPEMCDGIDNDCNGLIDEDACAGADCTGSVILGPFSGSFNNTDAAVVDSFPLGDLNCQSFCLSMDVNTDGLEWAGNGNLEYSGECDALGGCDGSPFHPDQAGCQNCWDFLYAELVFNDTIVYQNLLGDDSLDVSAGKWISGPIDASNQFYGYIRIIGQTWAAAETISYDNLTLICVGQAAVDNDGDGFADDVDCNDNDATIYPGAPEICDMLDNNCDGEVDEDFAVDLTCPPDFTINCTAPNIEDDIQQWLQSASASTPQSVITVSNNYDPSAPNFCAVLAVTFEATSICDQSASCRSSFQIIDMNAPIHNGLSTVVTFPCDNQGNVNSINDFLENEAPLDFQEDCNLNTTIWIDSNYDGSAFISCSDTIVVSLTAMDACENQTSEVIYTFTLSNSVTDNDGDGFADDVDCNDNDASIFPGALEICDGMDNDCDGEVDEDFAVTIECPNELAIECGDPNNTTTIVNWLGQANANEANGNPLQIVNDFSFILFNELCSQAVTINFLASSNCGVSSSCTSTIKMDDTLPPALVGSTSVAFPCDNMGNATSIGDYLQTDMRNNFTDQCGNGVSYGSNYDGTAFSSCTEVKEVTVTPSDSCGNIGSPVIFQFSLTTPFTDNDGDGFTNETDCNDANVDVYPGAPEICDGLDNNCNGTIDEGVTLLPFYYDNDQDGYGDDNNVVMACQLPSGLTATGGDCNDTDNTIYPGAEEICDALDNNCDGIVDEGLTLTTYYIDADLDGYGNDSLAIEACVQPFETSDEGGDCDDTNFDINPGAMETPYNGVDDDCDPATLDDDLDGDGFALAEDCDDNNAAINPDAEEIPNNGIDEDCDGQDMTDSTSDLNSIGFQLFPNPAHQHVTIQAAGLVQKKINVEVYTITGELVEKTQIKQGSTLAIIDVRTFYEGTYLIKLTDGEKNAVKELIIAR